MIFPPTPIGILPHATAWWSPFDTRFTAEAPSSITNTRGEPTGHYDLSILHKNKTIGLLLRGSTLLAPSVLESVRRVRREASLQRRGKTNGLRLPSLPCCLSCCLLSTAAVAALSPPHQPLRRPDSSTRAYHSPRAVVTVLQKTRMHCRDKLR